MNLIDANVGEEYIVKDIITDDEELKSFLFSLGCYSGEPITVVSRLKGGCVVSIKDARYNIDNDLAQAISIKQRYQNAIFYNIGLVEANKGQDC